MVGLGLALGLGAARSASTAWWPEGVSAAWDFSHNRFMVDNQPITAEASMSFVRASTKIVENGSDWQVIAPHVLARTPRGAHIEPAATNLIAHAASPFTHWPPTGGSKARIGDKILGIFDDGAVVISAGEHWHNLHFAADLILAGGTTYICRVLYQARSSPSCLIAVESQDGEAFTYVDGAIGALDLLYGIDITITDVRNHALGESLYEVSFCITPNADGPFTLYAGPNSMVVGQEIGLVFAQLEAGSARSSPIFSGATPTERAADVLTLHLPAGRHDLTTRFDDGTQQVSVGVQGEFNVPTSLARPWIRDIIAQPT